MNSQENRAMTLDEAILHCDEITFEQCNKCGTEHFQLAEWLRELKELKEQQLHNKWIPVSERLPESYQRLIVQTEDGYLMLSRFYCKSFYDIEYVEYRDKQHQIINNVIAWQPLPQPYQP